MKYKKLVYGKDVYKITIPERHSEITFRQFISVSMAGDVQKKLSALCDIPECVWDKEGAEMLADHLCAVLAWFFEFDPDKMEMPDQITIRTVSVPTKFDLIKDRVLKYEAAKMLLAKYENPVQAIPEILGVYMHEHVFLGKFNEEIALSLANDFLEMRFDYVLHMGSAVFRNFPRSRHGTKRIWHKQKLTKLNAPRGSMLYRPILDT